MRHDLSLFAARCICGGTLILVWLTGGLAVAAPTISITAPANGASVTGAVTITATAGGFGNLTKVAFYVSNTWKAADIAAPWAWTWDTTATPTGSRQLYVRGYDAATATWTQSPTLTVIVYRPDTTPPTGTVAINAGASVTNNVAVTLALSATDPENAVIHAQFSNDGVTYAAPVAFSPTRAWTLTAGDGVKTVYVKFKNAAGLWSAPVSDAITLDTTPPQVQITVPKDQQVLTGQ